MDGNEQFISFDDLYAAYLHIKSQYNKMTAECNKLLDLNTNLVAENNTLKVKLNQTANDRDIAKSDLKLCQSATKSLIIAVTETAR